MNHTRFADWVTIWVLHFLERAETGGPNYCIGPDCGSLCIAAVAGSVAVFRRN